MRNRTFLSTLTAFVFAAFIVDAAMAGTTKYFRPSTSSGNWNDDSLTTGIWFDAAVGGNRVSRPAEDDRAVILTNKTCSVNVNAVADTIDVQSGAVLDISSAVTLSLDNDNGPSSNSVVDGDVLLSNASAILEFKDASHSINNGGAGNRRIYGTSNTAQILVSSAITITLASGGNVAGSLEFRAGSGTLTNNGFVNANRANASDDTLSLYSGTFNGSGTYEVTLASATLHFLSGVTATSMSAAFVLNAAGTLDIDDSVCTTGNLTFSAGTIDVAAGKSAKFSGTCP